MTNAKITKTHLALLVVALTAATGWASATLAEDEPVQPVEPIVTESASYDPTILTKFIPAMAFIEDPGETMSLVSTFSSCINPHPSSVSAFTHLFAPVELPDGARIKQVVAYGTDTYASGNMIVELERAEMYVQFDGAVSHQTATVTEFTTSGASGDFAIASIDNLNDVAGSFGFFPRTHRFHNLHVTMYSDAELNHVLCGVEVQYQVPAVANATATAFYPIDPIRAFDSRIPAYVNSGLVAPNTFKVVSIKDAHNGAGAVTASDVIPVGATAVAYNITVTGATGRNYLAVTAGDATSFTASAINFVGGTDLANAAVVTIAADRTIKIWGGDQTGSTYVIIDITGYYAPMPNMGN